MVISQIKEKEKSRIDVDEDYPPPSHTKGKWKPRSAEDEYLTSNAETSGKIKCAQNEDINLTPDAKSKWCSKNINDDSFPQPGYIRMKWKPKPDNVDTKKGKWNLKLAENPTSSKQKSLVNSKILNKGTSKVTQFQENKNPTESYTKGKWLPSATSKDIALMRKSSGTIQYWCSACNRTLASKVVYERHLKSELHFKRTLHDREFDDSEEINFLKSIRRPKPKPPESIFSHQEDTTKESATKRHRKKVYMKCEVCQSKVNKYLIGKHLISHYHCRKGDITSATAKKLVLENIHEIVLEHPYQCSICKFYCNTHEYFLRHWLSDDHLQRSTKIPGYFFCIMCKYKSEQSQIMYNHLVSSEHNEVVCVINRSVPIIIKKINPTRCVTCNKEFTLKIQLIKHCEKFQHDDTFLKDYKMKYFCNTCERPFLSNVALRRHNKKAHQKNYFICTPCNLKFDDPAKAKLHRRSQEHKYKCISMKPSQSSKKKCKICEETFNNFLLLKEHLANKHPEEKIRYINI